MPLRLNDETDFTAQAAEARRLAEKEQDAAVKAWLMGVAREYDRLASQAKTRQTTQPKTA
jgi:hypothetical protein